MALTPSPPTDRPPGTRWSTIRLIWFREMRDQLRDRRTLFMIAGLPLVLYPVLGFAVLTFALGFSETPSVVGVVGPEGCFPPRDPRGAGRSPLTAAAWLTMTPLPGTVFASTAGPVALAQASRLQLDYPCLVEGATFTPLDSGAPAAGAGEPMAQARLKVVFLDDVDDAWLESRQGDLIVAAPPEFYEQLRRAETDAAARRPTLRLHGRPDDERSRLAYQRLVPLLERWQHDLKRVRLARRGLPDTFDEPFELRGPDVGTSVIAANVFDLMPKLFPFMLVMWSLAGALYPAVDLCAGEKERGTMETLLITPAGRQEIVLGKFLTIWVFSAGTALLNLLSMAITTWYFTARLPGAAMSLPALLWCVLLSLPQAALFSAVSLAIGAYARSTKEGQYYLMPLFLVCMPLIFLTLAPGVELNAFYSLVPVTGVALLMQRLMTASDVSQVPWVYFGPVLATIFIYSWLALRWAIEQFHREEVLFREAERWDWRLWFRRLLRDKEPLPTTAQALFCFGLILMLRWLSLGVGRHWPAEVHAAVVSLAFVAAPALFMAVMLNTLPRDALYLRWPRRSELGVAVVLTVLLLPPLTLLARVVYAWFPHGMDDPQALVQILRAAHDSPLGVRLLAFALVPACCEELAFRGFLLGGLQRHFRPRNAVLLGAFLYALLHLNVFLLLPTFVLGVVLGLLTVRSRSVVPAVLFHFLYNALLVAGVHVGELWAGPAPAWWTWLALSCLAGAAGLLWWLYRKPYADLERARRRVPPP